MLLENTYLRQNNLILQPILNNSTLQSLQSYIFKNVQSHDLEQNCLAKLKKQREKVEKIIKIKQYMDKQIENQEQQKKVLAKRIIKLQQGEDYKEKYQDLKNEFQKMMNSHELAEFQIEQLKLQLENTVTGYEEEINQLKLTLRREKDTNNMKITYLQSLITEKQEQILKIQRESKSKETDLKIKIQQFEQQNEKLRDFLNSQGIELEQTEQLFKQSIKTKDMDIIGSHKIVQQLKKQIKTLKFDLSTLKYEHQKEKEQYYQAIQQNRTAFKLMKKQKQSKENQNAQLKQEVRRYGNKNKSLQQTISQIKVNTKTLKNNLQSNKSKHLQAKQQQNKKLQQTVIRLKKQIQKHVEQYNLISIEYKRINNILLQKQQSEKQRKLLLISEFRQIDKIQKEVNRVK